MVTNATPDEREEKIGPEIKRAARLAATEAGYIAAIVVNGIMLYVMHNILRWGIPFITTDFASVPWAFDLSLGAQIVCNLVFLSYDPAWFKHAAQVGLNVLGFIAIYTLFRVFPFAFGRESLLTLVRLAMLGCLAAIVIATVVEFAKMVGALGRVCSGEGE